MKKIALVLAIASLSIGLAGCGGGGEATVQAEGSNVDVNVKIYVRAPYSNYFPSSLYRYDEVLSQSYEINDLLSEAEYNLDTFQVNMQYLVGEAVDIAEMGVADALKEFMAQLAEVNVTLQVTVYIYSDGSARFKVTPVFEGELVDDIQMKINSFEAMIEAIPSFAENLIAAGETSVELVVDVKRLIETVDTDFTGMNVVHAPKAATMLVEAATALAEVPGRVTSLVDKAKEVSEAIIEVFGASE